MIYLDYNATAPLKPVVQQTLQDVMALPGNPSSIHSFGRAARKVIEDARNKIASLIGCDPTFITFTSGATEANNTVLHQAPVERILISSIEHPSVTDVADILKSKRGINFIPVTSDGIVDLHVLEKLLMSDTRPTLISVMLANNETGVLQPIKEIAALAKDHNALLHVDAVQAVGKVPLQWAELGIDYLSLSAHKMGGPAGIGALVYDHDKPILKHVHGGGQERRRRAGTENMIGIAGFGTAAAEAEKSMTLYAQLRTWHEEMEDEILSVVPGAIIFGRNVERLGNTTQIALPGVTSEKQLIALDLAGFAVSSGSACSSGSIKPSHVLLAMGVDENLAKCAIRISSGWATTQDDIKKFTTAYIAMAQRMKGNI
ncbi:MAG TPA: cysteine desulfurase family protein [Alphaproteobacteria bacterium]